MTLYGTSRPHGFNKNAMALLGQTRDSWPSMAPLGHVELTKIQKLLKSKNKNQNENGNKNENSFWFWFLLSFSLFFIFDFFFVFIFVFIFVFAFVFKFLFLNFTMTPLGHYSNPTVIEKLTALCILSYNSVFTRSESLGSYFFCCWRIKTMKIFWSLNFWW